MVGAGTGAGGCGGAAGAGSPETETAGCSFSGTVDGGMLTTGADRSGPSADFETAWEAEDGTFDSPACAFAEEDDEALVFDPVVVVECFLEELFDDDFLDFDELLPLDFPELPEDLAWVAVEEDLVEEVDP